MNSREPGNGSRDASGQSRLLQNAFERFDRANAEDPNQEVVNGVSQPKALAYARRMTERLDRFAPKASEALRLAVRCQHIRRWTIPRSEFPSGRIGYREWRTTLAAHHAEAAAAILRDVGYNESTLRRVQVLVRKERLKADSEVQTLEDVACLVFLEYYLARFATEHDEAKLVEILRKTWRKMSDLGRDTALRLNLKPELRVLVEKAVAGYASL